jgi:4-hydroxy-4-methyl-2-oxoglutarate aldolase
MNRQSLLRQDQLDAIRQFDTCRIANAIETLEIRLRDKGYTRPGLKSLSGYSLSALGYAATVRLKTTGPPATGGFYLDRTDWWDYVVTIPGPRVAVFEDLDDPPGGGAVVGEVHVEVLRALGCVGVVTNGSVRDLQAARASQFPLFAQSTSVSHSYVHLVDFGGPVSIFGLEIAPGDLIYADCHGVLSIPLDVAHELPAIAARQAERERRVIDLCRSPGFSLEALRAEVQAVS